MGTGVLEDRYIGELDAKQKEQSMIKPDPNIEPALTRPCSRCGRCCLTIGPDQWKTEGLFSPSTDLANPKECPDISHIKLNKKGGCEMLGIVEGVPTCLVEKHWGRKAKPASCDQFPHGANQFAICEYLDSKGMITEIKVEPELPKDELQDRVEILIGNEIIDNG